MPAHPRWLEPIPRIAAARMPQRVAVGAPGRWLQRVRAGPADEHRSIIGIEREWDAQPVMTVAVRGLPHPGRSCER